MSDIQASGATHKKPAALLDYVVGSAQRQIDSRESWADTRAYNWQVIRALAYLYVGPETPLRGSLVVADAVRQVYGAICRSDEPPDNRLTGHLAATYKLLTDAGTEDLIPDIKKQLERGAEPLAAKLQSYRHITHFTSANLGTGSNHVAVYACAVYQAGQILGRDDYFELATSTMDRMAVDRTADGYWSETTGGPTGVYNNLTYCCFGRMARWTGRDEYREAALWGARFHRRFSYPDGCDIEAFDGRVRHTPVPLLWGLFVQSQTPEGRAFVARRLQTLFERKPPSTMGTHGGESMALLCENHEFWECGPVGQAECERLHYVERLLVPGGVRRHGPWCVAMQGIVHLPRESGGFTIDRTSLMSVWHEKTGLIINGSGEPGKNEAQTFLFESGLNFDKLIYGVPERFELHLGKPESDEPAQFTAEYRGGTARVAAQFVSDKEILFDVSVGAREQFYPVPMTLQLELRRGDRVNGVLLADDAVELGDGELNGCVETDRFKLTFPVGGAVVRFPYDPYNPYDVKDHKSPPEKYVTLLTVPVTPAGARLTLRVL